MVQRTARRVAHPAFEIADVLLRHACRLGEALLSEALLPPQPRKIPAHQPAHVHARKGGRLHTFGFISYNMYSPLPRDYPVKHIPADLSAIPGLSTPSTPPLLWPDLA